MVGGKSLTAVSFTCDVEDISAIGTNEDLVQKNPNAHFDHAASGKYFCDNSCRFNAGQFLVQALKWKVQFLVIDS